jgi:hypothetical protein
MNDKDDTLKNDLLKGVEKIADFIGDSYSRTHRLCQKRRIPAEKIQGVWHSSKRRLRDRYSGPPGGEAA